MSVPQSSTSEPTQKLGAALTAKRQPRHRPSVDPRRTGH